MPHAARQPWSWLIFNVSQKNMNSALTLKWMDRLERPRSIDSLISEVYGEAALYGSLYEREIADLLNFYDLAEHGAASMLREPFNTDDWGLSALLKEVKNRGIPPDLFKILDDGKEARNELVHRLIATELVISRADKEMLIDRIAGLFLRIWRAHKLATDLKKKYGEKLDITEQKLEEAVQKRKEAARIEDDNIQRILGDTQNEKPG